MCANGKSPVDWIEGVVILVAVLIVISIGLANDWRKEEKLKALDEKRDGT
jgi:Ca2+-transporting ATPase